MTELPEILHDWQAVRAETLELLDAVNDVKLSFTPEGKKWQPLSYQFACIGRTQLVYAWALAKDKMDATDFTAKGLPVITEVTTHKYLAELLAWSESEWQKALATGPNYVLVADKRVSFESYVYRLVGHERIHHGQIISYFTLAGYSFPKQFKQNWAL